MHETNKLTLAALVVLCAMTTGVVYLFYPDFVWLVAVVSALLCVAGSIGIHFDEKRQELYANRPHPPPFEAPVDDIIKRLGIDMMVFENVDREFFYVENLRHLTMADLDRIDLRRSVKCRLLECLHALVFTHAQLQQADIFSV